MHVYQFFMVYTRLFTVPYFSWDFRDLYASIELPPSWFVRVSATWGECLNYRGGPSQATLQTKMAAVQLKRASLENPTEK